MNNTVLIGRITKDLELNNTQSNISYVRFTLAVNRSFTNQAGEREADFINCIAWREQAENLVKFMNKGSQIGVQGRIQTGSYESDKGTVYTTDVVAERIQFLESKQENNTQHNTEHNNHKQSQSIKTDSLPF